jgi:hypothetical protein
MFFLFSDMDSMAKILDRIHEKEFVGQETKYPFAGKLFSLKMKLVHKDRSLLVKLVSKTAKLFKGFLIEARLEEDFDDRDQFNTMIRVVIVVLTIIYVRF